MANPVLKDTNVYVKAYFRINAGYVWGQGMDDGQYARFNEEISSILTSIGFEMIQPKTLHACSEAIRGVERLYCHPMDLSGYVKETAVREIQTALETANTFKLRNVDIYEQVYNYTEEEFLAALKDNEEAIRTQILEAFVTKRKNLFKPGRALNSIGSGLQYFRNAVGSAPLERIEGQFIGKVFDQLVHEGKIVSAAGKYGETLYRTVPEPKSKAKKVVTNEDNLLPLLS